jgi:lipoprotein-anchoring transpeptidase ErfK/SrfK
MKAMAEVKFCDKFLIILGFTVLLPLFSVPKTVLANPKTDPVMTSLSKNVLDQAFLNLKIPSLPALGDPSQYLPSQESQLRLVIRLSQRKVYVYEGETEITSYPIAIGKSGWETPTGNFQILQMLQDPVWEHPWTGELVHPGAKNPLGDRWIGFWTDGKNYIGFHGTPSEELVGQAVSHGCVRMKNDHIRALFEKVAVGTPVAVQP